MTTNAIRGMRRKKSALSEVKVAVIGAPGVGKSGVVEEGSVIVDNALEPFPHPGEPDLDSMSKECHQASRSLGYLTTGRLTWSFAAHCLPSIKILSPLPTLTVRFLTRRYIGEYDHQAETRYKNEVLVDSEPILFEILDTCPKSEDELPSTETLHWADGFLLVYSITDRQSFNYVRKVKEMLDCFDTPLSLVGNKADMVHLRQVSTDEGEILAKDFECWFSEVAAAEQVTQVAEAFHELCREVLTMRRKNKQSLLDRMLGGKAGGIRVYSRGKSDSALPKE